MTRELLVVIDLGSVIRVDSPTHLIDECTFYEKMENERWERSNLISMLIIKRPFWNH